MKLEINLTDPIEIRLAVEFMGKVAVHRDAEGCFHATMHNEVKSAVKEAEAHVQAEEAIEKASKPKKPKPEPVEVKVEQPTPAPTSIDKAEVQKLAQAKSRSAGVEVVKETIAKFGGTNINTTSADQLGALKEALEALA